MLIHEVSKVTLLMWFEPNVLPKFSHSRLARRASLGLMWTSCWTLCSHFGIGANDHCMCVLIEVSVGRKVWNWLEKNIYSHCKSIGEIATQTPQNDTGVYSHIQPSGWLWVVSNISVSPNQPLWEMEWVPDNLTPSQYRSGSEEMSSLTRGPLHFD